MSPLPIELDKKATTKRQILSSLNAVYDIFDVYLPILNRAKLFLRTTQTNKTISWDSKLPDDLQREWVNIATQANLTPVIPLERFVGADTDEYDLVAFSDASNTIYGVVVYLVNRDSGKVSFLCAKNIVVNNTLNKKTIRSLEFQAVVFATELLNVLFEELCGATTVKLLLLMNFIYLRTAWCACRG